MNMRCIIILLLSVASMAAMDRSQFVNTLFSVVTRGNQLDEFEELLVEFEKRVQLEEFSALAKYEIKDLRRCCVDRKDALNIACEMRMNPLLSEYIRSMYRYVFAMPQCDQNLKESFRRNKNLYIKEQSKSMVYWHVNNHHSIMRALELFELTNTHAWSNVIAERKMIDTLPDKQVIEDVLYKKEQLAMIDMLLSERQAKWNFAAID